MIDAGTVGVGVLMLVDAIGIDESLPVPLGHQIQPVVALVQL